MDVQREKNVPWLSVPQFGDWDQQKGGLPDYSMDFTKIREMRKQNKKDISRSSIGNEEELIPRHKTNKVGDDHHHQVGHNNNHSPIARRSIMSYFNCCIKA